eukprot:TRINITY_DN1183_c0_g1_i5.p1 TRINITY_DN1183_c0_g1~~TRINITY_DN1183_c0_g1_i5.p1  ORF type:complete len:377 (+),score=171.71 TRINITY_DN1183_c0_g1_i5:185-1315(+)
MAEYKVSFFNATKQDNTDVMREILHKSTSILDEYIQGQSPIHIAAACGHSNAISFLLDRGAQIDKLTKRLESALHLAAENGHNSVVQILISRGANVLGTNKKEQTWSPLHAAALNGHAGVVQTLLDAHAPIDKPTADNKTALQLAARNGHLEVIKILISKNSDVNFRKDLTALHTAAENGHVHCVNYLLDNGAEIDKKSKGLYKRTALHYAALNQHISVVQLLLSRCANKNVKDERGKLAVDLTKSETIKGLLRGTRPLSSNTDISISSSPTNIINSIPIPIASSPNTDNRYISKSPPFYLPSSSPNYLTTNFDCMNRDSHLNVPMNTSKELQQQEQLIERLNKQIENLQDQLEEYKEREEKYISEIQQLKKQLKN